MKSILSTVSVAALAVAGGIATASAEPVFNRIASFPVSANIPEDTDPKSETSAEIIAASEDGMTLVYSDSPLGVIGFVDISDPRAPQPAGVVALGGEPTAVAVSGGKVLVGVNTSQSYTEPSGHLAVIDMASQAIVATCDLAGQPDSVATSPDGSIVAIAIENERDEDLNDGEIPQMPAGTVAILSLQDGVAGCDSMRLADVTGLAEIGGSDPEPEFVDINGANEIVLTMQENNHLAVIDGVTGAIKAHFPAGTVDLDGIDTEEEGALVFTSSQADVRREPDAVKWLDDNRFVIANEGDYKGGSRGFTIFNKDGTIAYESGTSYEYEVIALGHYPEERSGNKGAEPEGLEVGTFGDATYMFVLSERGSVVGVYKDTGGEPELVQFLPSGIGPESAVAIPSRNLLASANEVDLVEDGGVRAHVMIYEFAEGEPQYPQIRSAMVDGKPIGWGALSGLAADPEKPGILYAVNDSFYGMQPTIFTIDANQKPALITTATRVTREGQAAQKLDLEGIASDGEGGFWLASEGRTDRLIPHALYHVDADGAIKQEIAFPAELIAVEKRWAAEGVTKIGDTLWIAIQRQWGDDAENTVKLVSYNLETKEWGAVTYPTDPAPKGWVGLSEITAHGDFVYIIERDNQIGADAAIKKLYRVAISDLKPAKIGETLPVVTKELVRDFIPDLKSLNGYVVDKIEGFAVDASGQGFAVTDNDGVDDSSGETLFFSIGTVGS